MGDLSFLAGYIANGWEEKSFFFLQIARDEEHSVCVGGMVLTFFDIPLELILVVWTVFMLMPCFVLLFLLQFEREQVTSGYLSLCRNNRLFVLLLLPSEPLSYLWISCSLYIIPFYDRYV
ncbi:hypothetical protein V8F33_004903 [Rhypophila sp. PSN 637]